MRRKSVALALANECNQIVIIYYSRLNKTSSKFVTPP
jgi:hypothetical protein